MVSVLFLRIKHDTICTIMKAATIKSWKSLGCEVINIFMKFRQKCQVKKLELKTKLKDNYDGELMTNMLTAANVIDRLNHLL